jgi:hypothetical protein
MSRSVLSPWETARVLHADLCARRSLVPVTPPFAGLLLEHDEWALGVFSPVDGVRLDYARNCGADVVYYSTGPSVIFGSPHFLAGYGSARYSSAPACNARPAGSPSGSGDISHSRAPWSPAAGCGARSTESG